MFIENLKKKNTFIYIYMFEVKLNLKNKSEVILIFTMFLKNKRVII